MDTRTFTRGFGAVALVLGPAAIAVGSFLESGSDSAAAEMEWASRHPGQEALSDWLGLGAVLIVPAMLFLMRLARLGAPRLGLIGGGLATTAWLAGLVGVAPESTLAEYAARLPDRTSAVALLTAVQNDPATGVLTLVFVVGHLVGMLLLGIGLVRARTVPRWAAVLVAASPVLHILTFPLAPAAEAAAYGLLTVATAACGWALWRIPNDRWDPVLDGAGTAAEPTALPSEPSLA